MNFLENIRLAWEGIRAGKMRAFLTMLGIIIGIGSVIGILTVGNGLTNGISEQMSAFGASNVYLMLQRKSTDREGVGRRYSDSDLMTDEMIEGLRARYPSQIKSVSLSENVGTGQAKKSKLYANISVLGINADYLSVNDTEILKGRGISDADNDGNKMNAVVSDKLVNNMFDGDAQAALGEEAVAYIGQNIYTFRIVGVYKYEASAMSFSNSADEDVQTDLYIPLSTAKKLTGAAEGYSLVTLVTAADVDSKNFAAVAENYINRFYTDNRDFGVTSMSMESVMETVDSMMDTLSIAIAVIAGISLLVGGIGVMNIMLVSVTERTKEIGTRKAIGATNADIRLQFVTESVIICVIGGVLGILLGALLGYIGSSLLGSVALPELSHIVLAVGFSMAIGIFFGYYPANKAAKLNPVDALRYE
ncbi:MAG: ABC transporter permease [Clostridia bacterium]|nr:ABC transporter permease [Clostridia bacterium]